MNPEEFRAAAHELVDWIADFRERVPELPVRSTVAPGEVRAALSTPPPETPQPLADLVADLDRVIVPGITQIQHPGYYAWFPANASLASVLGDLVSSGLGSLGITWQSSPALTELEEVVTEWLRELTGLSDRWHGAIHDTASTACLVAMLAARERASDLSETRGGLQELEAPLVVYASNQAHSSVPKAVLLAGYGRDNLRLIDVDPVTFAMDVDLLRAAIDADVAAGRRPAAIVAAVGTTATTAVDPVPEIVEIARQHGAWVHVDAAMAGSAMLLPECREMFAGVEDADSISWNPHKWLGTVLDTSLLYVRDVEHLVRVMSTNPSYLRSAVDGEVTQYKDWGIPLGRRFRALKLWFHLRLDGVEAIRERLRRDLANAQWLADQVRATDGWRVVAPVTLQTVCVRHVPDSLRRSQGSLGAEPLDEELLDREALDAHTLAWVERVNATGRAFITPAIVGGLWTVRISLGSEATERSDVADLWTLCRDAVA